MEFIFFTMFSLLWNVGWLTSPTACLIFCKYLQVWIIGMDFDAAQEVKRPQRGREILKRQVKGKYIKNKQGR